MRPEQTSSSTQGEVATSAMEQSRTVTSTMSATLDEKTESTPTTISTGYGWRFYGAFACLCLINLVCAVDATILSVALPIMATRLNGTATEAFWTGTSFLLTSTVFVPSWTSFSHIFGRKPALLAALIFFTVGAIICSAANNFYTLLVGRSVQGIGGGGLTALTYVIVTDMVTLRERGKWFSVISLQWAIGSISGPVIGGAIAQNASWRWLFILNFPFVLIAFIAIPIFLNLNHKVGSMLEKLKSKDWTGSFLFVASITSFLIPITWGGVMYDWSSWHTLVPLILGALGLVGFMLYSRFIPEDPIIRGSIFSTSTARAGYFGTVIHGIITWSVLYYMPLYYQVAQNLSPTSSGVALFPLTCTTAPAAVIVGLIIAKTGRFRPSIWVGWAITTLGAGLLILLKTDTSTVQWIFLTIVVGLGTGILYSAQSFAVQASASNADLPFAAAMYSFFRSLGQTLGVAFGGTIFQNAFKGQLQSSSNPILVANAGDWAKDASALVQIVKALSDDGPEGAMKREIVAAYVQGLKVIWIVICALAAVALAASLLWTKDLSLDRELVTEQGWVGQTRSVDEEEK